MIGNIGKQRILSPLYGRKVRIPHLPQRNKNLRGFESLTLRKIKVVGRFLRPDLLSFTLLFVTYYVQLVLVLCTLFAHDTLVSILSRTFNND